MAMKYILPKHTVHHLWYQIMTDNYFINIGLSETSKKNETTISLYLIINILFIYVTINVLTSS